MFNNRVVAKRGDRFVLYTDKNGKFSNVNIELVNYNGNDVFEIAPGAEFPTTYSDLSFTERMANKAAGYEPYKDMKAFTELKVESHETYLERHKPATLTTATTNKKKENSSYSQTPSLADNTLDTMDDEILFYL